MERLQWVLLRALLENFGLLFLSKSGHTEGIYHILLLLYYTSEERERELECECMRTFEGS